MRIHFCVTLSASRINLIQKWNWVFIEVKLHLQTFPPEPEMLSFPDNFGVIHADRKEKTKFFLNGQTFACPSSNFERYSFESSFPTKSSQWLTIQIPFKRNHRDLQCCSRGKNSVNTQHTHLLYCSFQTFAQVLKILLLFLRRDPAYHLLIGADLDLTASMSDRFHRHFRLF